MASAVSPEQKHECQVEDKLLKTEKDAGAYQPLPEYIANTKGIAGRHAALAGCRLADVLAQMLDAQSTAAKKRQEGLE